MEVRPFVDRLEDAYRSELGEVGAFLPPRVPLDRLPEPFQDFLNACEDLDGRYPERKGGVRRWLDIEFGQYNPDSAAVMDRLSEIERWTLFSALSTLGHTYRWDTVPPADARMSDRQVFLPSGIDRTWTELSRLMDLPRVGSMWSLHLCNWRLIDKLGGSAYQASDLTVDRLQVKYQWLEPTSAAHLNQFSLSFVLLEARGALVLRHLIDVLAATQRGEVQEMGYRLDCLQESIHEMSKAFTQSIRDVHVHPQTWLELVQPTFTWGLEENGQLMPGANAMQVPSIHCLDAALSVPYPAGLGRLMHTARASMPAPHRRFLAVLDESQGLLREFIETHGTVMLRRRFNDCVHALNQFRIAHRNRGARYLSSDRMGSNGRNSTGMEIEWRPPEGAEMFDIVEEMELIEEPPSSLLPGDGRGEEPTIENTFRFLTVEERSDLIENAMTQQFCDGDVIIGQGDRRKSLYVVAEGFVRIEMESRGKQVVLARLWPGEVFGEISFLNNAEATASAIAEDDTQVQVIDRDQVYMMLAGSPTFGMRFYQSLAVQVANRLIATNLILTSEE